MNRTQLIVMWIGVALFVLMGLFPPHKLLDASGNSISMGYYFIISKHQPREIDAVRLCVQWAMVVIVTSGFLVILKDKKKLQRGDDMPTNP